MKQLRYLYDQLWYQYEISYWLTSITVSVASDGAKFVNVYIKAFMFLRTVLLENNSPTEHGNDFIYK
jgi:hypothetical protein